MKKGDLTWERCRLEARKCFVKSGSYEACEYILDNLHLFGEEDRIIALQELTRFATMKIEEDIDESRIQIKTCIYLLGRKFSGISDKDFEKMARNIMNAAFFQWDIEACKYVLEYPCPKEVINDVKAEIEEKKFLISKFPFNPLNYTFAKHYCRIYFASDTNDKDVGNTLIPLPMLESSWTEKMSGVHPSLRDALKGRYDHVDSVENLNTKTIYKISSEDETVEEFLDRAHNSIIRENDEERLFNDPFAHKTND